MEQFLSSESESDEEDVERSSTPDELINEASEASLLLLPSKSKARYERMYKDFTEWKQSKKATSNSERTLLSYFSEKAKTKDGKKGLKPTTLWSKYSMLKATLKIYEKVDISNYASLTAFLKRKGEGHVVKKAKIFTEEQIQHFIDNAADEIWLDVKAVCVFCIFGASRTHELPSILMEHIARYPDMYYVTIPKENRKNNDKNNFAITGAMLDVVRKYEKLRPDHGTCDRFFLNYQNGKCTVQPIGKNKFYKMAERIAQYLNLPHPEQYTGHSLRRSSTTFLANTGANIEAIKRHTGHKSTKVCESYIEDSIGYSRETANAISASIGCASSSIASGLESSNVSSACTSDCNRKVESTATGSFDVVNESTLRAGKMDSSVVSLTNVGTNSGDSSKATTTVSSSPVPSITVPQTVTNDDVDDVGSGLSQIVSSSQVSSQNFMKDMKKAFAFYKCENLTINFNQKFFLFEPKSLLFFEIGTSSTILS